MGYDQAGIWQRGLAPAGGDEHAIVRERLRSSYRQFWANACLLANQIAKDLPGLTLHDAAHFEALWDRADQIAGPDLNLTPLEVYVFGGAVLLHDAANTVAAFENGRAGVEDSPEWKDVVAGILQGRVDDPATDGTSKLNDDEYRNALLNTLRVLHARQAEELAGFKVGPPNNPTYLIEDEQIRIHLGRVMGLIAASHHWNITEVEERLGPYSHPAISGFPRDWTIRPVLLSCLLRCADAIQIDQGRVPDFLYRLLNIRGVSETHWRAQNRLAIPFVEEGETHALVFRSTAPYFEEDADAWWVAYDAIQVAHAELRNCSVLLSDLKLPSFAVDRIRYAESPQRLSKLIEARGWRPVSAEVRVNQVDKVVTMFGGRELYGNDYTVPLREMIQNAADAVRQRRILERNPFDYSGRIVIHLERDSSGKEYWLKVEDDGLGMSEAALTGPLIDFGASYIASTLAKSERPGLSAQKFKRIGKYGVGFFSVFMLGTRVLVTSRPFDQGINATRTLSFRKGMLLRPLLLETRAGNTSTHVSTRIAVKITQETLDKILTFPMQGREETLHLSMVQLIGALCPLLDVDLYFQDLDGTRSLVHSAKWASEDLLPWLKRITLAESRKSTKLDSLLDRAVAALDAVDEKDPSAGFAALSWATDSSGVRTVGGLRAGDRGFNPFSDWHVGAIDFVPNGPQRSFLTIRVGSKIGDWARRQCLRLASLNLTAAERLRVAARICHYGAVSTEVATIRKNKEIISIFDCADILLKGESLFAILTREARDPDDKVGMLTIGHIRPQRTAFGADHFFAEEIEYNDNVIHSAGMGFETRQYYAVPTDEDDAKFSFLKCLENVILARGKKPDYAIVENKVVARYIGKSSERQGLKTGEEISATVLEVKIETGDSKPSGSQNGEMSQVAADSTNGST